jgi:hypothetical protein
MAPPATSLSLLCSKRDRRQCHHAFGRPARFRHLAPRDLTPGKGLGRVPGPGKSPLGSPAFTRDPWERRTPPSLLKKREIQGLVRGVLIETPTRPCASVCFSVLRRCPTRTRAPRRGTPPLPPLPRRPHNRQRRPQAPVGSAQCRSKQLIAGWLVVVGGARSTLFAAPLYKTTRCRPHSRRAMECRSGASWITNSEGSPFPSSTLCSGMGEGKSPSTDHEINTKTLFVFSPTLSAHRHRRRRAYLFPNQCDHLVCSAWAP